MAEVQVDQRVELGEASQMIQVVTSQVQGLDVAQVGVCRFQEPQVVIGQIHVDQTEEVLQSHRGSFRGFEPGSSPRYRWMNCTRARAASAQTKTKFKQNDI